MFIMYDTTMSADETMEAVEQIRAISNEQCFLSGMSAVVTDIRDLSDKEVPVYVLLAVILSLVVLSLTMDSFLIPIFFLLSIGMAIIYNLGTNVFMGEDILCDQGVECGAAARCDHGLFDFSVAQL